MVMGLLTWMRWSNIWSDPHGFHGGWAYVEE